MNPSFDIRPQHIDAASSSVCIEAGPMGLSYTIRDAEDRFSAVVIYAFPQANGAASIAEQLKDIIQSDKLLQQPFHKSAIIWTFPESILVPHEFMESGDAGEMLALVYGDLKPANDKSDFMFRHNLHNVYRVPADTAEVFAPGFMFATQTHQYSLLPDTCTDKGDSLYVIFYSNRFTAMLHKAGKLQVICQYIYQEPDDAVYHLLNTCSSFEVAIEGLTLRLSGMIDAGSNLYAAIYKYFLNIEFAVLPETATYTDDITTHPPHFFSHLFAQALCV